MKLPPRFAILFACMVTVSHAHADQVALLGQYISDDNTTMTVHSDGDKIVISGRGKFSMYNATCQIVTETRADCRGTGTRLDDRKNYRATYRLTTSNQGRKLTSSWTATYPNGEAYNGVTYLRRVN